MPDIAKANYAGLDKKRQTLFLAIDHLVLQATDTVEEIALPDNAPFGRIHVNSQSCTLCMGCTSVCPAKAIQAGDDKPLLKFIEGNCVQCGLCESACPEHAIHLQPRLLTDPGQRRKPVVVNEQVPFSCISCGKPFATQSIINNIMGKLSEHSMFQTDRAKQRLMMCEDCRVVDVVQDADAMVGALPGMGHDDSIRGQ
jgi:ferredoxin